MNVTEIREYAGLMQELGLTGLELTIDNSKVRLERQAAVPMGDRVMTVPEVVAEQAAAVASKDYISVTSPIVGVFYAAPAENAEPYVKVGDHVDKGQMLCIVEAMKLMNEIASDYEGEIAEICVTDGQVVEYGTELFRIK